jgi:hypothetical protein
LTMPTIHLGVYLTSGNETYQAVRWALEVLLNTEHPPIVTLTRTLRLAIEG